jgi:(p)ppGpp synthase/HD superfamily hydrolase
MNRYGHFEHIAAELATQAMLHYHLDSRWIRHVAETAWNLKRFGINDDHIVSAAWLHDTLEDCPGFTGVYFESIQALPNAVWDIVRAVTDKSGRNRRERHEATYSELAKLPEAVLVKLADRISNVEESIRTQDRRLKMYRDEHEQFRRILCINTNDSRARPMWRHLDALLVE